MRGGPLALVALSACSSYLGIADEGPVAASPDAGPPVVVDSGTDASVLGPQAEVSLGKPGASALALDATNVYWTNPVTGEVLSAPKSGTKDPPRVLATGQKGLADVVVDAFHVYFARAATDCQNPIGSVAKDGSSPTSSVDIGQPYPCRFVVRMTGLPGFLYAVGDAGATLRIGRVPVAGGYESFGSYYIDVAPPPTAVATDGVTTYYGFGGAIYAAPKTLLVAEAAIDIVADAGAIYWLSDTGSVRKLDRNADGGAPIDLATKQVGGWRLAQDGADLFFTALGSAPGGGKVARVPKAGGAVEDLATSQDEPRGIAVDASGVYWVNETTGAIRRRPR